MDNPSPTSHIFDKVNGSSSKRSTDSALVKAQSGNMHERAQNNITIQIKNMKTAK